MHIDCIDVVVSTETRVQADPLRQLHYSLATSLLLHMDSPSFRNLFDCVVLGFVSGIVFHPYGSGKEIVGLQTLILRRDVPFNLVYRFHAIALGRILCNALSVFIVQVVARIKNKIGFRNIDDEYFIRQYIPHQLVGRFNIYRARTVPFQFVFAYVDGINRRFRHHILIQHLHPDIIG